jgi:hypothetical protein
MTEQELKDRLTAILLEEDQKSSNWQNVEAMCLQLSIALRDDPCDACPHDIYHFVADCGIRRKDQTYAEDQRAAVRAFLGLR